MRKLTYFIACSLDGFIGDPTGEAEFFNDHLDAELIAYLKAQWPETLPTHVHGPLGLGPFEARRFDTVIQGRNTYECALKAGITSPYAHLRQYVVSRSLAQSPDPAVQIVSADVAARVRELKAGDGLDIWLCGGAQLAGELVEEIDEFVLKTYPVFLGSGMPLSTAGFGRRKVELTDVRAFAGGTVVSSYRRLR
ncbi:dihydrofolate reductase family protein [Streptomyces sp. NPDC006879]|uniref:dihydrofolate reductase family protein n=1 Tax=Streptomyces sp. NPDC006879 TaxID=3364767 RepID=UPI00367F854D